MFKNQKLVHYWFEEDTKTKERVITSRPTQRKVDESEGRILKGDQWMMITMSSGLGYSPLDGNLGLREKVVTDNLVTHRLRQTTIYSYTSSTHWSHEQYHGSGTSGRSGLPEPILSVEIEKNTSIISFFIIDENL